MIEYRIECTLQEIERLRCRFGRNLSAQGEKTKSSIIYANFSKHNRYLEKFLFEVELLK